MGYSIHEETIKSSFKISKENMERAFPILKEKFLKKERLIRKEEIEKASCFDELIEGLKWHLRFDKNGNGVAIFNEGLNVAEEEFLFKSIAEFMEDGSYVIYERQSSLGNLKKSFEYKNGKVDDKTFFLDFDQNGFPCWFERK